MNPMMKLLARNRGKGLFRAEAPQNNEATVYLYDIIVDSDEEAEWLGGVSPGAFARTLSAIHAPVIHLRVNSPGGSVFGGRAIEQALREHPAHVIAHIDGLAASAASSVIMGANERVIAPGAFLMIHRAWTLALGNAEDMLHVAGLLDQIDGSLAKTYARITGMDVDTLTEMMSAETWIEADDTVQMGFVDRVAEDPAPRNRAGWDLSAYAHPPEITEPEPDEQDDDSEARRRAAMVAIATPVEPIQQQTSPA